MRPGRFRASCDEILMAEIGPNASGGTENPLGKTETGTRKVTSRPTAPNQSVMATPTCQRRRNLHGFRKDNGSEGVIDEESLIFETSTSVTRRPSRTDPYRESRIPHPDPWGILPPAYGSDHTTSPLRTSRERPPPKCPRLRELSSSYVISLITGRITRVTSRFVNAMLVPEVHRFHSYTQIIFMNL